MPRQLCTAISVAFNNSGTIERMMRSVDQERDQVGRLIIVDNGSSDSTVSVIERVAREIELECLLIRSTNTGFAGGYATARAHIVSDDPILCINPDLMIAPGTIELLLTAVALDDVAIATAPLVDTDGAEDSASRRLLPTLGTASLYALFGKLLPDSLRYNARPTTPASSGPLLRGNIRTTLIEATTGALMMFAPTFRSRHHDLFDTDYWMYGEDLQVCADAGRAGLSVLIVECTPSLHIKGISSGRPRSPRSDKAFHDAMYTFYRKNLRRSAVDDVIVRAAITVRYLVSRLQARAKPAPRG